MANGWFFYVVLLAVLLSFRRGKTENEELLEKKSSSELKGLAILMVLLGHMTLLFGFITMPVTPYLGAQAVEIFLFLSGYGLAASFCKKGLKGFWKRKAGTVYLPFLFTNLIKLAVIAILAGSFIPFWTAVLNLVGIQIYLDTSMWYVQYILLCFILFYLSMKTAAGKGEREDVLLKGAVILTVCFAVMALGLNVWKLKAGNQAYIPFLECNSHYFGFPLGVWGYLVLKKIKKLPAAGLFISSVLCMILYAFFAAKIPVYGFYLAANTVFVLGILCLFLGLARLRLHSLLLEKLGGLSYHIYLNEMVVMSFLPYLVKWEGGDKILIILAVFAISVGTAWLTRKACDKLTALLNL